MNQILKALLSFIGITCFAYGLEAQVYSAVTTGTVCPSSGVACSSVSYSSGLCVQLDYFNTNTQPHTVNLKVKLSTGGNFPTNGTIFAYDGGVCTGSIASVAYNSNQSSKTIAIPLTFPAGTTKSFYVTLVPNTTNPPNNTKRWAGPFMVQAVACTTNVPLLNSPADGHVYASNTVNGGVGWSANGNNYTVTYKVTVKDMSTNPITVLVNNQPTQATFLSFSGLIAGHNYQWFVKAEKYGCTTTTSATKTFSVAVNTTGSIIVSVSPSNIGGKWRVDGGAWYLSGQQVIGLSVGNHTVDFLPVTGYTTPPPVTLTVTAGNTTGYTVIYTPGGTPTICGTVRIIVPQNGANNIARSAIVKWEHELGRSITKYSLVFRKVSNNQVVTINGLDSNIVQMPATNTPAVVGFLINNSTNLDFNTVYRITLRAFNVNNQQLSNNVAGNFTFTTMESPVEEAGCAPNPPSMPVVIPYNQALGHLDNVVVYKNGKLGTSDCAIVGPYVSSIINPGGLLVDNNYGRQCVEYIMRYTAMRYGILFVRRDAKNYFHLHEANLRSIKEIRSGIDTLLPQSGDVIVFDGTDPGHIAIIRSVNYATGDILMANQNVGSYSAIGSYTANEVTTQKHINYPLILTPGQTFRYTVNASTGVVTLPNFGASYPALCLLRCEPRMFVSLGASKIATGNSTMMQFNAQPTLKIDVHAGTPVFSLDIALLNTTTGCYEVIMPTITNIPNDGNAIPNIPTLVNGTYKARVTCTTNGVASRPVYFERVSVLRDGADDRVSDESRDTTKVTKTEMMLMPNPADKSLSVVITSSYEINATLSIYDGTGKQVIKREVSLYHGEQVIELTTDDIANGLYICRLTMANGEHLTKQLSVQH